MAVYIKVPSIVTRSIQAANPKKLRICDGCVAQDDRGPCSQLCAGYTNSCGYEHIYIEDTEAARLAYIMLKLET